MKLLYKIYFVLVATVIFAVTVSCSKQSVQDNIEFREMILFSDVPSFVYGEGTKGFVPGTSLYETATGQGGTLTPRTLFVTAYSHMQDGSSSLYFSNEEFVLSDEKWRHSPAIYWPFGAQMDFIAYSSSIPFDSSSIEWGSENEAERMRLTVSSDFTQDDILYAAAWHTEQVSVSDVSFPCHHSQAWIQVKLTNSGSKNIVLTGVCLANVYDEGVLEVINNYGHPEINWDFRNSVAGNRQMDDIYGVVGTSINSDPKYFDMFLPEQEKSSIIVSYISNGVAEEKTFTLSHSNWLAGQKYVYEFDFN